MHKAILLLILLPALMLFTGCCKTDHQPEALRQPEAETPATQPAQDTASAGETTTQEAPKTPVEEAKVVQKIACNNPAPSFTLADLKGNNLSLADYTGKVVILDFWAVWCGPCRMEIPGFIELQNKYGKDGLVVIGVSLDRERSKVPGFAEKQGINYPIVYADQSVIAAYGNITSIPTTFIIDRNGCITEKLVGYHPKDQFEKLVKPLLDKKIAALDIPTNRT